MLQVQAEKPPVKQVVRDMDTGAPSAEKQTAPSKHLHITPKQKKKDRENVQKRSDVEELYLSPHQSPGLSAVSVNLVRMTLTPE